MLRADTRGMYTRFDVVGDAEARAKGVALEDRRRYEAFVEAAERYAAENDLVVGGPAATRLLLESGGPADLDSFQYDFFSGQALARARGLGDALYALDPQGLGHYVAVLTKVPDYLFAVSVDGRDLFTVTALPVHRGVRTADIVMPSRRPAQFATRGDAPVELACMGPEIQLMGLYAALCDPGRAAEWGELLAAETGLRALLAREVRAKIAQAVARGSAAEGARTGGRDARRARLFRRLHAEYASGPDRVLVGPGAVALLTGGQLGDERVQVLTASPLDAEAQVVAALARAEGFEVQWGSPQDPKIPVDPRLRRLTVHLVEGSRSGADGPPGAPRREPIMDLYNVAAHDLVPYVTAGALASDAATGGGRECARLAAGGRRDKGRRADRHPRPAEAWSPPAGLKVGTPFVLMRFRLADMWTMQVLMRMGAASAGYAKSVLLATLADFEAVAAYYEEALGAAASDPEGAAARLLPLSSYVGRLEDPGLALKRAALGRPGARHHYPYFPAQGKRADQAPEGGGEGDDLESAGWPDRPYEGCAEPF
jgi:hypothetical protein